MILDPRTGKGRATSQHKRRTAGYIQTRSGDTTPKHLPTPPPLHLDRDMQQPIPKPTDLLPPRRRQPSRADVELQRLVQQPRLGQPRVAALAPRHELGLGRARLEVLVGLLLLGDCGVGAGLLTAFAAGGVVVAGVDLCGGGEGEEFGYRGVQIVGVAVGKVAAGGADVGVEEGVAAEDVGCGGGGLVVHRSGWR